MCPWPHRSRAAARSLRRVTADDQTIDTARRLLDAQVAWTVRRLTGPELAVVLPGHVDSLLEAASRTRLGAAVPADDLKALVRQLAHQVPPSAAASTLAEVVAETIHDGSEQPFTLGEVIDRSHVERIVDELLANTELLETTLDDLTRSPEVATLASRFLTRIVQDVMQTNRAVAEKIPGMGSLVSLGAGAAGLAMGAADKQLGQLVGGTAGKGAVFAMRRLNKVLIETLRDPAARTAMVEIFDLYADQPISAAALGNREDAIRFAGLAQDVAIHVLPSEPVLALVDRLVDRFLGVYGDEPIGVLLDDLGVTRDDAVAHATALALPLFAAAHESGELERVVRSALEPFYSSREVLEILRG